MRKIYEHYLEILDFHNIPEFLGKYLTVPSLTRLKNIGYFCGMDYASKHIYQFKEKLSRYDHSLSVALLTWKFTHDKKATLAGLFHDVATPCFSHVIDYMNHDYEKQESTEELTADIIKNDKLLCQYLDEDGITCEDIIDFKRYSIVDTKRPKLCADRLDGIILTGYAWIKSLDKSDITNIISDVTVYENEDNEKELGFIRKDIASKVLEVSHQMDTYCHTSEDNYMMELLAQITRVSIERKIITYEELFYLCEFEVLERIRNSNIRKLEQLLFQFEQVTMDQIPETKIDQIKMRLLDPLVNGIRLSKVE